MATPRHRPAANVYKEALQCIADDIRGQLALEEHQRIRRVDISMIDRVRADSYRRIVEIVEESLGITLRNSAHHL